MAIHRDGLDVASPRLDHHLGVNVMVRVGVIVVRQYVEDRVVGGDLVLRVQGGEDLEAADRGQLGVRLAVGLVLRHCREHVVAEERRRRDRRADAAGL